MVWMPAIVVPVDIFVPIIQRRRQPLIHVWVVFVSIHASQNIQIAELVLPQIVFRVF